MQSANNILNKDNRELRERNTNIIHDYNKLYSYIKLPWYKKLFKKSPV